MKFNEIVNYSKYCFSRIVKSMTGFSILKRKSRSYELVFPSNVSEPNVVPHHITPPMYVVDHFEKAPEKIIFKTDVDLPYIRQSCSLAKKILNAAGKYVKVGVTTDDLDKYVHKLIIGNLAYPSPLHYAGYPKSICTSVNNVACHGIPDDRPLANGDIITIDVSVFYQGYHGDCASTFLVGDVDDAGQYLVTNAERILYLAISKCKPGESLGIIGETISKKAKECGLNVIPGICGHGIGRYFHEFPQISHEESEENVCNDVNMKPGMTFTIEPVIGEGEQDLVMLEDGWTLVTEDDSRTAQFEHTILITDNGAEILTK